MIGRLIAFSAQNRLLVLLATLLLTSIGIWSVINTPLDALPDLSDTQVIVYTEYPGQAPQVVEDQVTYPLATALLAVPHAKVVRGFSNFAVSFVYVAPTTHTLALSSDTSIPGIMLHGRSPRWCLEQDKS